MRVFGLAISILLFVCFNTYGQIIPFKNYTVRDGLPSNYVSDVVQDKKGYMWFATDFGLAKFDGYNFRNYTIEDGLSDNFVNCVVVDSLNRVYAGTEIGGVSVIQGNQIRCITTEEGLISDPIEEIFIDAGGSVWACGSDDGVSIITSDTILSYTSENSIIKSNIFCHFIDAEGIVWLGNWDGLYYYDTTFHKINHLLIEKLIVWDIIEDRNKDIWIASQEHGVFCISNEKVYGYNTSNGLTSNTTLSIVENESGDIIVGTYRGGLNIIRNGIVFTDYVEQTSEISIWELKLDSKGRVWGRSLENGVIQLNEDRFQHYSSEESLISDYVLDLYEDVFGNIWFVAEGGISKYGKAFFEIYQDGFVDDYRSVISVLCDRLETYAGTYRGLSIFKGNDEITHYSTDQGLPDEPLVGALYKRNNVLWLGTPKILRLAENKIYTFDESNLSSGDQITYPRDFAEKDNKIYGATANGLLEMDIENHKTTIIGEDQGLPVEDVYAIEVDADGRLWCGTSGGLVIIEDTVFRKFTTFHGLSHSFCNDICFDATGVAWIATDYGLTAAVLDSNVNLSTRQYTIKDGLVSSSILSVLVDEDGEVWAGHNKGIDVVNPKTKHITHYGLLDGFLPLENNSGAIDIDNEGNIWFGTVDGLVKYSMGKDVRNNQPPKLYITNIDFYLDSSKVENYLSVQDSILKLPFYKNNLVFSYVGLHYTIVEKNKYKYRLLGYEDEWSEPTTEIKTPPYRKLPHGKYTFQVMAANCDGVWTVEPSEYSFRILPPWWETVWARILQLIILLFVFWLVMKWRLRKLQNDKKILALKVKERTREVVLQKDQIEEQRDEISRQKQEITDSIKYAENIQSAILVKDETISTMLDDYFILFKPRDIVSGDFYWIDEKDGKVIAIAADCTGHGVPGAFMSMLGVSILNQINAANEYLEAGEILNRLRKRIIETLSHSHEGRQAKDGMDLAMCIIDKEKKTADFAGAYNPLILVRNKEIEVFKGDKMPVGALPGELSPFSTTTVDLQTNDCLYMFSDGYADQFGGPDGKKFKSAPFKRLLAEISDKPMHEQKAILDNTIEDWMKNEEQIDDILVVGIRII